VGLFGARSIKEELNKVTCSRRALALCLVPGLPKAPSGGARRAGDGLGVLPRGKGPGPGGGGGKLRPLTAGLAATGGKAAARGVSSETGKTRSGLDAY
jgi:hypothetical protein